MRWADLIKRADLCKLLDVDDRTLSRMIIRGDVPEPAFKSGKTIRWRVDQFPGLVARDGETDNGTRQGA
jgi:hypothetical protein